MKRTLALLLLVSGCSYLDLSGRPYPCETPPTPDPQDGSPRSDGLPRTCPSGWSCGRDSLCHDDSLGSARPCGTGPSRNDGWCTSGWKCGLLGVCVQPQSHETQLVSFALDAGVAELLSPLWMPGLSSAVAISPERPIPPGLAGASSTAQELAVVADGGLFVIHREHTQLRGVDGGFESFAFSLEAPLSTLVGAPTVEQIALSGGEALALSDNGLWILPPMDSGTPVHLSQVTGTGLVASASPLPAVVVRDAGTLWTIELDGGGASATVSTLPAVDAVDPISLPPTASCSAPLWLSATGSQLLTSQWQPSSHGLSAWSPTPAPIDADAGVIARLGAADDLIAAAIDDGSGQLAVTLWERAGCSTNGTPLINPSSCYPCGSASIATLRPINAFPVPRLDVDCVDPTYGVLTVAVTQSYATGFCSLRGAYFSETLFPAAYDSAATQTSLPGALGITGWDGELWFGGTTETTPALTLDRLPRAIVGREDFVRAYTDEREHDWEPGWGFLWSATPGSPSDRIVAPVRGPGLFVSVTLGNYTSPPLPVSLIALYADGTIHSFGGLVSTQSLIFAQLAQSVTAFAPPYSATAVPLNDGNMEFVVTAGEALLAGNSSRTGAITAAAPIELRAVPSPGAPITSAAILPQDAAGNLSGYVLTGTGLYSFTGRLDQTHWQSAPIDLSGAISLSGALLTATQVWSAGTHAWLGMSDGSIFTLPGLVQVGPPLPPPPATFASAPVPSFAQLCGALFAYEGSSLYRLDPAVSGSASAQWSDVTQALIKTPYASPNFTNGYALSGALFTNSDDDELYVVNAFGVTSRISAVSTFSGPPNCTAP